MSRAKVFRCHTIFSEGRTNVENEAHCGRPSTTRTDVNLARVRELVRSERRLSVKMVAEELNISRETVRLIICAKWSQKTSNF